MNQHFVPQNQHRVKELCCGQWKQSPWSIVSSPESQSQISWTNNPTAFSAHYCSDGEHNINSILFYSRDGKAGILMLKLVAVVKGEEVGQKIDSFKACLFNFSLKTPMQENKSILPSYLLWRTLLIPFNLPDSEGCHEKMHPDDSTGCVEG